MLKFTEPSAAPVSTIICWIIAGACYWLGRKRAAKEAAAPKGEATAKGGAQLSKGRRQDSGKHFLRHGGA
jgi:hypothetical protein